MFSYGQNNEIDLNSNKITQLTAPNGSGKSSVALILQELLYSKNIKSIKKADILNRYTKSDTWSGVCGGDSVHDNHGWCRRAPADHLKG